VLLRVGSDGERRHVDYLLANTDVSLSDEHASVVDGLGESLLEDLGLQTTLHQSLRGQLKNIIQSVLLIGHKTVTLQAADKGGGLKQALGVLAVQGKEGTSSLQKFEKYGRGGKSK
jgi:hypothetical protein